MHQKLIDQCNDAPLGDVFSIVPRFCRDAIRRRNSPDKVPFNPYCKVETGASSLDEYPFAIFVCLFGIGVASAN
jgi:hypothetical protein